MKNFKNIKIIGENKSFIGDVSFDKTFMNLNKNNEEGEDYSNKIMLPGFFDVHSHGAIGLDFSTIKNEEEVKTLLNFYKSKGVTSLFPTLLTEHDDLIFNQLELLYKVSLTEPIIKGIHLEGPFISHEYKGAQLDECIQKPSIDKCKQFVEHSHGLFKYMTIAPERENSEEVIRFLTDNGIRVSMGHSAATFDETKRGVEAGATSITHCLNAMKGIHQHFPSIATAALYFDSLYTEVILDGIHVNKEVVEWIRKIKGNNKVIGITDSLMAAGLPDGEYKIGNTPIIVKDHDCKIKETGVRAGSTLTMDMAFKHIKEFSQVDDVVASHITSLNAARMTGLDSQIGSIKEGKNADFIVMNENYEILETYINGERVYQR